LNDIEKTNQLQFSKDEKLNTLLNFCITKSDAIIDKLVLNKKIKSENINLFKENLKKDLAKFD